MIETGVNLPAFTLQDLQPENFNEKLDQLKNIFACKKQNNVPGVYYGKVLTELVTTDLSDEQEKKIHSLFKKYELTSDGVKVLIQRGIRKYNPKFTGTDEALDYALYLSKRLNFWDTLQLKELSPTYHEQIAQKYQALPSLKTRFEELISKLSHWNDAEQNKGAIALLKQFRERYQADSEYITLNWDLVYNLVRGKICSLSNEEGFELLPVLKLPESNFNNLKINLLYYVLDKNHLPITTNGSNKWSSFDLEFFFNKFEIDKFRPVEIQHIAQICAAIELTPEEEKLAYKLLPKEGKETFLLERFRQYCRKLNADSKIWSFDNLKAFFDLICYKFYYKEIEGKTFHEFVGCCYEYLKATIRNELYETPNFSSIQNHYECCFVMAQCKKLKALENNQPQKQLKKVEKNLKALAEKYVKRSLDHDQWLEIFHYIKPLELPEGLYRPILEIFKVKKEPNTWLGSLASVSKKAWYGVNSTQTASTWKGEKYDLYFNRILEWITVNERWITENLKEEKDNTKDLIKKVENLLQLFKDFKSSTKDNSNLSTEEIIKYNSEQSEKYTSCIKTLREVLADSQFQYDFNRYLNHGPEYTSGCALILKELCNFRFTGMDNVPFIVKLMKEMIPLGLERLASTKREVAYLAERELLKYNNCLLLPLELQNDAIEGLPDGFKIPYLSMLGHQIQNKTNYEWDPHKMGNVPYRYMRFEYSNLLNKKSHVDFIRFATPTNSNGIVPEFEVFLRNSYRDTNRRIVLISLQSTVDSNEATRQSEILKLNGFDNVFVAAFPVTGDFYKQEGVYAEPNLYPLFEGFKSAISEKFIAFNKGQIEFNKPGNYLIDPSLLNCVKFKKALGKCIDEVKEILFPYTEALDNEQRKLFLQFFNIRLAFFLIAYNEATLFGINCNHSADRAGVYNDGMMEVATILFDNKHEKAFGEGKEACTFQEMQNSMVNGVPLVVAKRAMNHRQDELEDLRELLRDPEVRQRLRDHKEIFRIEKMAYPDFTIKPIEEI